MATITEIGLVGSVSPWWEAIALTTVAFSLYLSANATPISTCDPSTSWSSALPISCNNPALRAKATSRSSSAAISPEI